MKNKTTFHTNAIAILALILAIITLAISIIGMNWIFINNQREIATELILSAKVKCLETQNDQDCETAREYLKDLREKAKIRLLRKLARRRVFYSVSL